MKTSHICDAFRGIAAAVMLAQFLATANATPPVITGEPSSVTVPAGGTATFTVTATGNPPLTYHWRLNGAPIAGTNSTLTLTGVADSQAGGYTVVVTSGTDSVTSAPPAILTVTHPPVITVQPASQVILDGQEAFFSVSVNGATPFTYQWSQNGTNLIGQTDSSLDLIPSIAADAGSYLVAITNSDGSAMSASASLTIVEPHLGTSQPINTAINTCSDITFTVTASSPVTLTYQWYFGNTPVGSDSTNFTVSNVKLADAGTYSVVVTDPSGANAAVSASITVTDPPPVVVTKNITIQLDAFGNASITPAQVDNGSSDNCGISGMSVNPNTFTCANVGPNLVTLYVTDSSNQMSSATAFVTVQDITPPVPVFNTISVQLDNTGNYTLTPTDMANIGAGSSDACGIAGYSVTPASFTFCDVGGQPVTLTVTDMHGNHASASGTITVLMPTGPPAVVAVDPNYTGGCAPVTFPLSGGSGTYYVGYNAFPAIQTALNAVAVGGTVNVAAGLYSENLAINNQVTLAGAGSGSDPAANTIVAPAVGNTPVITISASGSSVANRLVVSGVRVTGATGGENPGSGIEFAASGAHYTFSNVTSTTNSGDGLAQNLGNGGFNNDIIVSGCSFSGNGIAGFRLPTGAGVDGLVITNSHFDGNTYGIEVFMGNGSGSVFQNVDVSHSTFNYNSSKGTYFEKLNNATFSCLTMINSGYSGLNAAGFNINLKFGAYGNIAIINSDFINCGNGDGMNGGGLIIEARGTGSDSSSYTVNPATLAGVTLANLNVTGSLDGIRFGEPGKNNVGPTGVTIYDCNLSGNASNGIHNDSQTLTIATSNWWGSVSGPSGAANPYGTGSGVNGLVSFSPWLGDGTDTSVKAGFQPNQSPIYYPPAKLVFTTQPGNGSLGSPLSAQPVVQVEDAFNNLTPWANPLVTMTLGNNLTGAVLTGTNPEQAVGGIASFTDLTVAVSGGANFDLVASAPSLTSATSSNFDVANPAPSITSLVPAFAVAGDAGFVLTVNGANFGAEYSMVRWNGSARTTTYVSPTQLTAVISASDIASTGTANVTVLNVAPGGGESAPAVFNILAVPTTAYVNATFTSGGADDGHLFGYDAFTSVQAGVNRVASGGTVNVAAGTYNESVTLNKSVSLLGANQGIPGCGPRAAESFINAGAGNAITVTAANVIVDGFELSGVETVVDTAGFAGATIQNNTMIAAALGVDARNVVTTVGANFILKNNCITMAGQLAGGTPTVGVGINTVNGPQAPVIQGNSVQGAYYGYLLYGLTAGAPTVVQGGSITGVMQGVAILNINPLNPTALSASAFAVNDVSMSGFSGNYPALSGAGIDFQAGIYVFSTGPIPAAQLIGVISNVTVMGTGKISPDSTGIYLSDFSTVHAPRQTVTVKNSNISTNSNRGISVSGSNAVATVTGSSILGNGFDPYGIGGNFGFGIIGRNNAQVSVSTSFIVNPATVTAPYTVRAIEADANTLPLGPTMVVTGCSILNNGNPSGLLASQDAGTLNASGNYWGTTSDTTIAGLMNGVVDFTPYLDSGVDTDLDTPGFQGDFSTLHVTTLGAQTGGGGRIQEGIDTVVGGTVYLQAGTFVEGPQILIDKDITMIGDSTATTIVKPSGNTSNSGDSKGWFLVQSGMNFSLSKVTLDGTGKLVFQAIRSYGLTSVDSVHFTHIQYNASGPDYAGTGVVGFDNGVNPAVLNVSNCQLDNIGRIGIFYFGKSSGTASGNSYTGKGPGNWLDYGVELGAGAHATVSGNTISGNKGIASVDNSASGGVIADSFLGMGTKLTATGNTVTGNSYGVAIGYTTGDTTAALLENNNLTANDVDGLQVVGGALVDAGDCTGSNFSGLHTGSGVNGSSAGGNNLSGYGFDSTAPWAIENLNGTSPAVLAYENIYGAGIGDNLAALFSGNVQADQAGGLLVLYPGALSLQCLSGVPAGATDLAGFQAEGGVVSATSATVSFSDAVVSNTPNNRVITRTYTLTDVCGQTSMGNQVITVVDTIPPVVSQWPANATLDVNGQCNVAVPNLTTQIHATDNCGLLFYSQLPTAGTLISLGTNIVAVTVTDGGGNSVSSNITLVVVDTQPAPLATFVDLNYANLPAGTVVKFPYGGSGADHYVGCDAFGAIQPGINRVAAGGTLNVAAGTYVEDVVVNHSLSLLGPNAEIDPNTGTRVAEAIIQPLTSDPNPNDANAEVVVYVTASNVTIKGFTVDGDNPAITSGVVVGTADVDASEAIASYEGVGSITVANNIVKNTAYTGIDFYNYNNSGGPTADNHIRNNRLENIGYIPYGFGIGVIIYNNFYADICSNQMVQVRVGVQTGNFNLANPGTTQSINNNNISCTAVGIFHNLAYESASSLTISNNAISFLYEAGAFEWDGLLITSIFDPVGMTVINNTISGTTTNESLIGYATVGYNVWGSPTTSGITIAGGSISNANYGAWVNNYDGYFSPGDSTSMTVSNMTIAGASQAGVYVQDDPLAANGSIIRASVTGNTVITGSAVGVLVQGPNAGATVINNSASITGNGVGVQVDTGVALVENNDLTGNTTAGISVLNGAKVDAGDCTGSNLSGLGTGSGANGSSAGLNNLSGYGFDNTAPWAIMDGNSAAQSQVLAYNNNYGAAPAAFDIGALIFDGSDNGNVNSLVIFSQQGALVATPSFPGILVQCPGDVPPGVTTLTQYQALGGAISATSATVSYSDSVLSPGPWDGTITRTYTLTDTCGNSTTTTQIITVSDTTPPVVTCPANVNQSNDPGACGAVVTFPDPVANDNCGIASVVATPPSGSFFPVGTNTVVVVATDHSGNTNICSFTVTVNDGELPVIVPPANITRNNDPTQCGAVVTFAVTNVTDNCGVASIVAVPASGSTFSVGTTTVNITATDIHGNAAHSSFTVTVNDNEPPTIVCPANIVHVNDPNQTSAVVTFALPGGHDNCGVQSVVATPPSGSTFPVGTTTVNVLVTDIHGNTNSCSFTVTVNDLPVITTQPASITNNAGTTATFTVAVSGTTPFGYQWIKNGTNVLTDIGNITGSMSNTLTLSNVLAADAGDYSVVITNIAGMTTSASATLTVIDPVINQQPVSTTNIDGAMVSFSVVATGTAPLTYQWRQGGLNIFGATDSSLTLPAISDTDAGSYTVVVSNSISSVTSAPAILTIIHPPVFVSQPVSVTVNLGQSASFSVSVNGQVPFSYQWMLNGTNINGATSRVLTINPVMDANAGSYSVFVSNPDGTNTSSSATLTVIDPPVIITQPSSRTNNAGTTAMFMVSASGTAPSYQWFKGAGSIAGATTSTLTLLNVSDADVAGYSVVLSNAAGVVTSSTATLTVIDAPLIITQPSSRTNNAGTTATFTVLASGTAPSYQWFKGVGSIAGATTSTLTLLNVSDADVAGYSVVLSNAAGVVTSHTATLTVIDPPVIITQPSSRTNNAGTTATFTVSANGTAPSYQWFKGVGSIAGATTSTLTLLNVSDTDVAGYSVVLSNAAGVVTSSTATLTVIDPPVIITQPSSRTNNAGTTATFTVSASGTAPSYQWFKGVGSIAGATTSTLTLLNVSDADVAGYSVVLSNAAGVLTSSTATLTVIDGPTITGSPSDITTNAGSVVTFSVTNSGTAPFTYQWIQNGTNILVDDAHRGGSTNSTLTISNVLGADGGVYTVAVSNPAGTVTSTGATLTVFDPIITNQPVSLATNAESQVTFAVGAYGTSPLHYQWRFNGANVSAATTSALTLTASAAVAGNYTVVVTNTYGSITSVIASLVVNDPAIVNQPTNITAFDGDTVVFHVGAVGTPTLTYQWQVGGVNVTDGFGITGSMTSTLTISNVTDSDDGTYTVIVANGNGSITSAPAILITHPPLITSQPVSTNVLINHTATFSVSANGQAPFSYQWQVGGTNIPGATDRILTIASAQHSDAGVYDVLVTNPEGTQTSRTAALGVYDSPGSALTIQGGGHGAVTVTLTGVPGFNYILLGSPNLQPHSFVPLITNASPFSITITNPPANPIQFFRGLNAP